MRIVNFEEFAKLPEGTIFSFYQPMTCEGLHRKDEMRERDGQAYDFRYSDLIADHYDLESENPEVSNALTVRDDTTRWGRYEYDQRFAIYEPADIQAIGRMLGIIP